MKFISLLFLVLLGASAWAHESCNGTFEGGYFNAPGVLTVELYETSLDRVNVTVWYNGRVYNGRGFCDGQGLRFELFTSFERVEHVAQMVIRDTPTFRGSFFLNGVYRDDFSITRQ